MDGDAREEVQEDSAKRVTPARGAAREEEQEDASDEDEEQKHKTDAEEEEPEEGQEDPSKGAEEQKARVAQLQGVVAAAATATRAGPPGRAAAAVEPVGAQSDGSDDKRRGPPSANAGGDDDEPATSSNAGADASERKDVSGASHVERPAEHGPKAAAARRSASVRSRLVDGGTLLPQGTQPTKRKSRPHTPLERKLQEVIRVLVPHGKKSLWNFKEGLKHVGNDTQHQAVLETLHKDERFSGMDRECINTAVRVRFNNQRRGQPKNTPRWRGIEDPEAKAQLMKNDRCRSSRRRRRAAQVSSGGARWLLIIAVRVASCTPARGMD